MTPLSKSPFSRHFNVLLLISAWYYETNSIVKLNIFILYKLGMTLFGIYGALSMMADFYLVMWDVKKMSWNLCVSALFIGMLTKTFQLMPRYQVINRLRLSLHKHSESRSAAEDILIHKTAIRQLQLLQFSFYGSATIFVPIWLVSRFYTHKGELPIPIRLLFVDLTDDTQFKVFYSLVALCAVIGLILVIETELAMFSLLIQISREYTVLIKDISQLNELYEMSSLKKKEINPFLKKMKTKLLVKDICARQRELIDYIKIFEMCYTESFLHEFFVLTVLIITIGLQFMLDTFELSGNLVFQIGYLALVMVDMFLLCWYSSKLNAQCYQIGEEAYFTLWYRMEVDCQKDIGMIIMRSQHPPKITTGKLMVLDLHAFMSRIGNIISWLTVFRGLLIHSES